MSNRYIDTNVLRTQLQSGRQGLGHCHANFLSLAKANFYDLEYRIRGTNDYDHTLFSDPERAVRPVINRINPPKHYEKFRAEIESVVGKPVIFKEVTSSAVREKTVSILNNFNGTGKPNVSVDDLLMSSFQTFADTGLLFCNFGFADPLNVMANSNPKANSGYPFMRPKSDIEVEIDTLNKVYDFLGEPTLNKVRSQPSIIMNSFGAKGSDNGDHFSVEASARVIWNVPYTVNTLLGVLCFNAYEELKDLCAYKGNFAYCTGKSRFGKGRVIRDLREIGDLCTMDATKFDSNVEARHLLAYFANLMTLSQIHNPQCSRDVLFDYFAILVGYIIKTPYVFENMCRKCTTQGVPSGVYDTGVINSHITGSSVNYTIYKGDFESWFNDPLVGYSITGDDLVWVEQICSLQSIEDTFNLFNFKIDHSSICQESKDGKRVYWHGAWWLSDNKPYVTQEWAIAHTILPSHFIPQKYLGEHSVENYMWGRVFNLIGESANMVNFVNEIFNRNHFWKDVRYSLSIGLTVELPVNTQDGLNIVTFDSSQLDRWRGTIDSSL